MALSSEERDQPAEKEPAELCCQFRRLGGRLNDFRSAMNDVEAAMKSSAGDMIGGKNLAWGLKSHSRLFPGAKLLAEG